VIVPTEVQQWYGENRARLETLEREVRGAMEKLAKDRGYLYSGRIKTVASLAEKIDLGRIASFTDLDDAYAGTIVIPTYAHESDVRQFLSAAFFEVRVRARGEASKASDSFRFDSTRVYLTLRRPEEATSEHQRLLFEVQILSAFDYAWQKVTHDLVYKHETVDWQRSRAAAQMKAVVEQLDAIAQHFDSFAPTVARSNWPEIDAKNETVSHLESLFTLGKLPEELKPAFASRVAEAVIAFLENDGCRPRALVERARAVMADLDAFIDRTAPRDIPRSLTLAQLIFGVSYRSGTLSARVRQRILLSEAMVSQFPELRTYGHAFGLGVDAGVPQTADQTAGVPHAAEDTPSGTHAGELPAIDT